MKNSVSNSTLHIASGKILRRSISGSLIALIFCISCGSLPKNARPSDTFNRPVSWFESDTGHFLFNTSIDAMKNHFSGLTVVKPLETGNYRVVMITETGLKILDMEFFPDTAPKVHFIMDAMDKKILIRLLQRDMSIMLMNHVQNISPVWYENFPVNPGITALFRVNGERYFYILDSGQVHPSLAILGKGRKFKTKVDFFGTDNSGIDSLKLSHYNIDLSIRLFRIHEIQ